MVISTEFQQPDNVERVRDFEMFRPKWNVFISPSFQGSGIYVEEKAKRNQEPEEMHNSKERVFQIQREWYTHELTDSEAA